MQETSKEIPPGSLPRSIDVILRHDIVEIARAGDSYVFQKFILLDCTFFFALSRLKILMIEIGEASYILRFYGLSLFFYLA